MKLLSAQSVSQRFDGVVALDDVSFAVDEGQIIGILGPNGAGKSTLFNVLTGLLAPDCGEIRFKEQSLIGRAVHAVANSGIARTFQDVRLVRRMTVLENVMLCFRKQPGEHLANILWRPGKCKQYEDRIQGQAEDLLRFAGLSEMQADCAANLSYGQQKLLSLVCCLAADADLLLLDEPVAGIAPELRERILKMIAALPSTGKSVVVIEHDVEALREVAHWIVFLDSGRKVCEGTPESVLGHPRVVEAYLG